MSNTTTTNLDALIGQERRRASERIAKIKRAANTEQRRIDAKVIELLRDQNPDLHDRLSQKAREDLEEEKVKRSGRAKKAATLPGTRYDASASQTADPGPEGAAPWND